MTDPRDNVIDIASPDRETEAWKAYVELPGKLVDDPKLLIDRPFQEELERRLRRWIKLFSIGDGAT